ncbi:MAG: hypothetical protein JWN36_2185 [Microbacteriaceae bacterium]|nr:hypothetical protein [Microbacteriaceae bacterium]
MVLRLDPRFPILWRNPHGLQVGVDAPRALLDPIDDAEERVVAALAQGVSPAGLEQLAEERGLAPRVLAELLARLAPVLLPEEPVPGPVVAVHGGRTATRIAAQLRDTGVTVEPDAPTPALAILAADYVVAPDLLSHWLRRDVPHLPVVIADRTARIGPLVVPGVTACLHCSELAARDADPARSALASQLWGMTASAATTLVSDEAAAIASRMALAWLAEGGTPAGVELDAATGSTRAIGRARHPECGCSGLDLRPARPGSATASAPARDPIPFAPTRARAGAAPA